MTCTFNSTQRREVLQRASLGALCAAGVAGAAPAVAQEAPSGEEAVPAEGYSAQTLSETGFVPADPSRAETVNGGALLLAAYASLLVMLLVYLIVLARRTRGVADGLRSLERRLEDLDDQLDVRGP